MINVGTGMGLDVKFTLLVASTIMSNVIIRVTTLCNISPIEYLLRSLFIGNYVKTVEHLTESVS